MSGAELDDLKEKWRAYALRMEEGETDGGSIIGAAYIIARSAVTDVAMLVDELDRLALVAEKARGLVRTAHPEVGQREVVRQWWVGLVEALDGATDFYHEDGTVCVAGHDETMECAEGGGPVHG